MAPKILVIVMLVAFISAPGKILSDKKILDGARPKWAAITSVVRMTALFLLAAVLKSTTLQDGGGSLRPRDMGAHAELLLYFAAVLPNQTRRWDRKTSKTKKAPASISAGQSLLSRRTASVGLTGFEPATP
ncbi:hypothetical protein Kisp02_57790 [Kineosporia sp. NBRC 101731]|nr:hypothetical protein Kisp02_57790 [Kineosporia sp. NBRC 101731]